MYIIRYDEFIFLSEEVWLNQGESKAIQISGKGGFIQLKNVFFFCIPYILFILTTNYFVPLDLN